MSAYSFAPWKTKKYSNTFAIPVGQLQMFCRTLSKTLAMPRTAAAISIGSMWQDTRAAGVGLDVGAFKSNCNFNSIYHGGHGGHGGTTLTRALLAVDVPQSIRWPGCSWNCEQLLER